MDLIAKGAEAQIIKIDENTLRKERLPKKYRLEIIDKRLRKFRNKREFKVLTKLHESDVNVPKPYEISEKEENISFTFEYIQGSILKNVLDKELLYKALDQIIYMHNLNIVHGDLTTLNMIEKDKKVFLIDFGLADFSNKGEDKAVDLNLFFTCIKNEHPDLYNEKDNLLKEYKSKAEHGEDTLRKLINIEHRGRNK